MKVGEVILEKGDKIEVLQESSSRGTLKELDDLLGMFQYDIFNSGIEASDTNLADKIIKRIVSIADDVKFEGWV